MIMSMLATHFVIGDYNPITINSSANTSPTDIFVKHLDVERVPEHTQLQIDIMIITEVLLPSDPHLVDLRRPMMHINASNNFW